MKLASLAMSALVFAACGGQSSVDSLRSGIPSKDMVALTVPGGSGQTVGSTGQVEQGLQGDRSEFYTLTRFVTVVVNTATGLLLDLLRAIVRNPPTSSDGHVAVWGPYTDALSPNTWRFTVRDAGHNTFIYVLEGKPKNSADTAYVTVLSGSASPALDSNGHAVDNYGSGSFTIDWTAASTLPEHDDNVGTATFTYSRLSPTSSTQIDVAFHQVRDRGPAGGLIDANYHYLSNPGADGNFSFVISRTNHVNPTLPPERASINSRWKNTGAGRADVRLIDGSPVTATINECWDQNFASRYLRLSWTTSFDYGDESHDCAFIGAQYASP